MQYGFKNIIDLSYDFHGLIYIPLIILCLYMAIAYSQYIMIKETMLEQSWNI